VTNQQPAAAAESEAPAKYSKAAAPIKEERAISVGKPDKLLELLVEVHKQPRWDIPILLERLRHHKASRS
jgi:hypothetical protein